MSGEGARKWARVYAPGPGGVRVPHNPAASRGVGTPPSSPPMPRLTTSVVFAVLALAGCSSSPDGPTLDGVSPEQNGTLQPDASTTPGGDIAPEASQDPNATLAPDATLQPDTTTAP